MWLVSRENGSAAAGFVLVAFPMLALFYATISITLGAFTRLVLIDATLEGARFAALADQDVEAGMQRSKSLIQRTLGPATDVQIDARIVRIGDIESVHFKSHLNMRIFPWAPTIQARSVAIREREY